MRPSAGGPRGCGVASRADPGPGRARANGRAHPRGMLARAAVLAAALAGSVLAIGCQPADPPARRRPHPRRLRRSRQRQVRQLPPEGDRGLSRLGSRSGDAARHRADRPRRLRPGPGSRIAASRPPSSAATASSSFAPTARTASRASSRSPTPSASSAAAVSGAVPGGRLQALGIAWDTRPRAEGGQRWFHLFPGERLAPPDPLHWTGREQTWNFQCAECHSTDLRKNYDPAENRYATAWAESPCPARRATGPARPTSRGPERRPAGAPRAAAGATGLVVRLGAAWGRGP